ncbi:mitochondrial translation release factor in rescue-like [Rhynchophorus ferrugineus]|uniref:mitochondrial translation release factor in rescue-like n=1 Tax=Rhynchophorus ferrugineus TaxID=354439 RepID=UPI003FCCA912
MKPTLISNLRKGLFYFFEKRSYSMQSTLQFVLSYSCRQYSSYKKYIDYSKVPVLKESDLYEQFVKGSGPGGSKINTTSSCVVLKHIPTGLIVKCQKTRFLNQNQSIARELLLTKLDNLLNGNDSVESQKKRLAEKRSLTCRLKKEKLKQMKETWKERESVT